MTSIQAAAQNREHSKGSGPEPLAKQGHTSASRQLQAVQRLCAARDREPLQPEPGSPSRQGGRRHPGWAHHQAGRTQSRRRDLAWSAPAARLACMPACPQRRRFLHFALRSSFGTHVGCATARAHALTLIATTTNSNTHSISSRNGIGRHAVIHST